jgi:hypothetical protein
MDQFIFNGYLISIQLVFMGLNIIAIISILVYISILSFISEPAEKTNHYTLKILYNFKRSTQIYTRNKLIIDLTTKNENLAMATFMQSTFFIAHCLYLFIYLIFCAFNDNIGLYHVYECYISNQGIDIRILNGLECVGELVGSKDKIFCYKNRFKLVAGLLMNVFSAVLLTAMLVLIVRLSLDCCVWFRNCLKRHSYCLILVGTVLKMLLVTIIWLKIVPHCDLMVNKNEIVLFFSYFSLTFSSTFLNLMILWTDELTKTQII